MDRDDAVSDGRPLSPSRTVPAPRAKPPTPLSPSKTKAVTMKPMRLLSNDINIMSPRKNDGSAAAQNLASTSKSPPRSQTKGLKWAEPPPELAGARDSQNRSFAALSRRFRSNDDGSSSRTSATSPDPAPRAKDDATHSGANDKEKRSIASLIRGMSKKEKSIDLGSEARSRNSTTPPAVPPLDVDLSNMSDDFEREPSSKNLRSVGDRKTPTLHTRERSVRQALTSKLTFRRFESDLGEHDTDSIQETEFDRRYEIFEDRVLGEGMFSEVCAGRRKVDDRPVAIKIIKRKGPFNRDAAFTLKHESLVYDLKLSHPNVVATYDLTTRGKDSVMVLEYVPGGTLKDLVDKYIDSGGLSARVQKAIFHQLVEGLAYLHEHLVVHRDIKPENILLDYGGSTMSNTEPPSKDADLRDVIPECKYSDFGLSKVLERPDATTSGKYGSPLYIAPEVVNYVEYGVEPDVWSLACVIYFVYTGKELFDGDSSDEVLEKVRSMPIDLSAVEDKEARALLSKMLNRNQKTRMTAANALDVPYFEFQHGALEAAAAGPGAAASALSPFSSPIASPRRAISNPNPGLSRKQSEDIRQDIIG
ncbi:Myosin light chain kinase A [Porphyridium purpureum]|uniref:Myosin light chain kinase A n=1 Tax=Porphyridium purpureum TaxID=35688 RepID=A0A5J4YSF8_PORPP|nr:Myosin light chain kinase A [Porphyridium purpureum]|eukprot:POR7046..scf236_6